MYAGHIGIVDYIADKCFFRENVWLNIKCANFVRYFPPPTAEFRDRMAQTFLRTRVRGPVIQKGVKMSLGGGEGFMSAAAVARCKSNLGTMRREPLASYLPTTFAFLMGVRVYIRTPTKEGNETHGVPSSAFVLGMIQANAV